MSEKNAWIVVRSILSLIAVVFLATIIWGDRTNCGIDKATLACRWSGSILDIVGTVIFLASLVWFSGLADKISGKPVYDATQKGRAPVGGLLGFIGAVIGFVLIWL